MREIYVAREPSEAHLISGFLVSRGIPAEVVGDQPFWADGSMVPKDMRPVVRVPEEVAERAIELLKEVEEGRRAREPWTCPTCLVERGPQFSACWKCGATRPE